MYHQNGFMATCWLWTASDGVQALLVLEPIWTASLSFVIVEHSVYHEPVFVLINITYWNTGYFVTNLIRFLQFAV